MNFSQKKIGIKELIHYSAIIIAILGILFFINKIRNEEINLYEVFKEVIKDKNLIFIELFLFILNFSLETFRWKILYRNIENISFLQSLKTVLLATAFGNSTPGGLGEHIARINGNAEIKGSLVTSVIASFLQTTTIVLFALFAFVTIGFSLVINRYTILFLIISISFIIFILVLKSDKNNVVRDFLNSILSFDRKKIFKALGFNTLRYIVFSFQLFLLLNNSNEKLDIEILIQIPIYYLMITIIPVQRILDIGIKGSVAIYVFGNLLDVSEISSSILFIWLLNTLVPSLIGITIFFHSLLSNKKRTCN